MDESTLTSMMDKTVSLIQLLKAKSHSSSIRLTVSLLESSVKIAQKQPDRAEKVERVITLLKELREQFVVRIIASNFYFIIHFNMFTSPYFRILSVF